MATPRRGKRRRLVHDLNALISSQDTSQEPVTENISSLTTPTSRGKAERKRTSQQQDEVMDAEKLHREGEFTKCPVKKLSDKIHLQTSLLKGLSCSVNF